MLLVVATTAAIATAQERDEKQAIEDQQEFAKAQAPRATKDPANARPIASPDPEWPSGIFETSEGPFSSSYVRITNQWQSLVDGVYVRAYAGALTADSEQGFIIVVRTSREGAPLGHQTQLTPRRSGSLRIESVADTILKLTSARGEAYRFDVRAGRFLTD